MVASLLTRGLKMTNLHPDPPYEKPAPPPKSRFMALTSNCDDMPTLFVDTLAPLDVLYDAAPLSNLRRHPSDGKPVDAGLDRMSVFHPQQLCIALRHSRAGWV